MKKSIIRIFIMLILVLFILNVCLVPTALAKNFNPENWKPNSIGNVGKLGEKANIVLGVIQVIGTVIAVITLAVIGIKYMTGSVAEKAEYKKTMLPWLIGAVMLFATSNLVQIIFTWANTLNS